jgi:tetratricopeptide (TPR) repeat protein
VPAEAPYTLRSLERMLGVRRHVVAGLIQAGYVTPARGARNEYRFTFRDVVLLRTAVSLQAANVSQRKLLRALRSLRAKLPDSMPLSSLRITAIGDEVAVREGGARWSAGSGQLLLDLEVTEDDSGSVSFINRGGGGPGKTAADWFEEAEAIEGVDPAAAEAAYREVLGLDPDHVYAYVNLGALLCEAGRCHDAVSLYEVATRLAPDDPLVQFNRAIALEDVGRPEDALASYERCLTNDPTLSDAHFNAARLCDKLGDERGALRHFSAYRRLQRAAAPADTPP